MIYEEHKNNRIRVILNVHIFTMCLRNCLQVIVICQFFCYLVFILYTYIYLNYEDGKLKIMLLQHKCRIIPL